MNTIYLDGRLMTDKDAAYDHIAARLNFPDWFGHNLDALFDCLAELEAGTYITIIDEAAMLEALGDYGRKLITVFEDAQEEFGKIHFIRT